MFHFVLCFAQNQVFNKKSTILPPFLWDGKRYRAETFFTYTRYYLECVPFFSKNIALMIFGSLYKICPSKKTSVSKDVSGIIAFFSKDKRYKETKKITHFKQCPVLVKNFSARSNVVSWRNGDKNWGHFDPLWPHIFVEEVSGNFESIRIFALLIKIYLL
jgi:hypothetical protein